MVLRSRVLAPDWTAGGNPDREAKCRKHPLPTNNAPDADSDPWFYAEEEAAHICNGTQDGYVCPFRAVCLHRALVNNEQAGTFGGLTTEQRRWVRRNRDLIPRETWTASDLWRHVVPEPEFFARSKEDDDEEEPEAEAVGCDGCLDRVEEGTHDAAW